MATWFGDITSVWSSQQKRLLQKWTAAASEVKGVVEQGRIAKTDDSKIDMFFGRMSVLEKYYSRYEDLGEELRDLNETIVEGASEEGAGAAKYTLFPDPKQENVLKNVRTYYLEALEIQAGFNRAKAEAAAAAAIAPSIQNVTVNQESGSGGGGSLPKLQIPHFDGQYENWVVFRDTYQSIVHNNAALTPTQKFHYLINALSSSPARSVISSFSISDTNYEPAFQALLDAFDNKRIIASSYLNKLLNYKAPSGRPTHEMYQQFMTKVSDSISALRLLNIENEAEFIYFHLASQCLDNFTREQFEFKLKRNEFPTVKQLTEFIRERQLALQLAEPSAASKAVDKPIKPKPPSHNARQGGWSSARTSLMTGSVSHKSSEKKGGSATKSKAENPTPCYICKEVHGLRSCVKFHHLTPKQRYEALKGWTGCRICLVGNHTTSDCRVRHPECRLCTQKHSTMLCLKNSSSSGNSKPGNSEAAPSTTLLGTTLNSNSAEVTDTQVVLGTAMVHILDARGIPQRVRVVLDSASQYSYMTQRCLHRLGLTMTKSPRAISCLGGTLFDGARGVVKCEISSPRNPAESLHSEAVVVRNITSFLPSVPLPSHVRKAYCKYQLADPTFFQPSAVDFLAGGDIFPYILSGAIESVGDHLPKLLETIFGYVVLGKYTETKLVQGGSATSLFAIQQSDESTFDLKKFWEVEEVLTDTPFPKPDHEIAEQLFVQNHYRLPDGRFGVRLPLKPSIPNLVASEQIAKKRFYNLEAKLLRNPALKAQYSQFMQEYIDLGHMEVTDSKSAYVIPHHGITKEDRNKIKLRVVFDAACDPGPGSLNHHMFTGPPLQNDVRDILINFRTHKIVFVADIVKMYRQIEVHPADRAYQHILWRPEPTEQLQKYALRTVTYGMNCSPYLSLRCLRELQTEHQSQLPLACRVLERDVYVDDFISGADTLEDAQILQHQVIDLMSKGCFELAKWASNSAELLKAVSPQSQDDSPVELSVDECCKVLGLKWEPSTDTFSYSIQPPRNGKATKRGILSTVAGVWDPVGFLSPITILFKILIQDLWIEGVTWDGEIPSTIEKSYRELVDQLGNLSQIQIPRWVGSDKPYTYQIVGFSDASEKAYAAAVYIRVLQEGTVADVRLLTAKTKVAPTKRLTIPKLELCGALLLARLFGSLRKFIETLNSNSIPTVCFTDSAVTLAWIKIPSHKLKVFVGNRVEQILNLTPSECWQHVSGSDNPSDSASRGILPNHIINFELWWNGPVWLTLPIDQWPRSKVEFPGDIPEVKRSSEVQAHVLLSCSTLPHLIDWMSRFSDHRKLIRVTALILRVIYNRKNPDSKRTGAYLLVEIVQAFHTCVKLVQLYGFFKGDLNNIDKIKVTYQSLSPFLDDKGILRVGGRIRNADIGEDQKHQILLPSHSHFTTLLVDHYHQAYKHPGPNLLQALLQTRVWIPALRRLVRQRTRKCLRCFKLRASAVIPSMGDLPEYRLKKGRSFLHVGMDFAGPFDMKDSNRRKSPISKVYLCIYVCMVTKALHLEAVTSLSTEAFLASFTRFIARRGRPSDVYSDNGTNFLGASRELKELEAWYNQEQIQNDIHNFSAHNSIQFHFNPPYTPHFGGLWESGVKSVKRHLSLVAGDTPMTYEEISTLFAQIEAVLNSRPLCPLSNDPAESNYLSPGHFLIGEPLLAVPEPTLLDTKINLLSRWQLIKRLSEDVWSRWRLEYLSTLQKRTKWHRDPKIGLQVGDLVLLKTKDAPPLQWPTGKIIEVHPGSDNQVRVVTLKTPTGVYKRSSANLIPLLPLKEKAYESDGEEEVNS